MISLPSSRIATVLGSLFGLPLGIPGVVAGVLAGRLLDSVLVDIRARRVICALIRGVAAPRSPYPWHNLLRHPLYSLYVRDAGALGFGKGAEEYLLLISIATEFHRGASLGVEPPDELCEVIGKYMKQHGNLNPRGMQRLCSIVYRASRPVPLVERFRLLESYAGDYAWQSHISFLRSLLSEYPDGEKVLSLGEQSNSGDARPSRFPDVATGVPVSPRLVWDDTASVLLGLEDLASESEVRAAFREKARSLHPDVQGDNEEFIALREAYETLLSRFGAQSEDQAPEGARRDPHNRARSDRHC